MANAWHSGVAARSVGSSRSTSHEPESPSSTLYDWGRVTPGVLVRQNFSASDTNDTKAAALARRIRSIAPDLRVTTRVENIVSQTLAETDWDTDVDLVIDATASLRVRSKLEAVLKEYERHVPIASVMVSAAARHAVAALAPPEYRAGASGRASASRHRGRNSGLVDRLGEGFLDLGPRRRSPPTRTRMFPIPPSWHRTPTWPAFQPKHSNAVAEALAEEDDAASGFLISRSPDNRDHQFRFRPDIRWVADGLDFRMSTNAWRDMTGWIRAGSRERSPEQRNRRITVRGARRDAGDRMGDKRQRATAGQQVLPRPFHLRKRTARAICAGTTKTEPIASCVTSETWHSHPVSPAEPSNTDYASICAIFAAAPGDGAHQLMVIVGHAADPQPQVGAYAFEKRQLAEHPTGIEMALVVRGGVTTPPPAAALDKTIGLSLSGGGSRAVAFHLGTLRALEDLKLLDGIAVISGVSGGSVMTGLLGYTDAPFADVDRNAVAFLRRGLVMPGTQ